MNDAILHKEKLHAEAVSKINYYIVGLIAASLYVLITLFSGKESITLYERYALVAIWSIGVIAFFAGIVWIYLLSEYYAAQSRESHSEHRMWAYMRELILDANLGALPNTVDEIEKISSEHEYVRELWEEIKESRKEMKQLWPKPGCKWYSITSFSVYKFGTGIYIIILGLSGVCYLLKM